jgi:AcrR family transcriptional regulator
MDKPNGRRRRGAALEDALLDAAWAELSEQGYMQFTAEAVAKRSGTSRMVLHRRWPSRAELAAAAIGRHVRMNPIETPDLGNIRDELLLLLRRFSDRLPSRLVRLVFEMSEDMARANSNFLAIKSEIGPYDHMKQVLDRAIARGEIDSRRLTPRLASLPTSLARHEMMMTLEPLTDEAIREIVDQIFLPLVTIDAAD